MPRITRNKSKNKDEDDSEYETSQTEGDTDIFESEKYETNTDLDQTEDSDNESKNEDTKQKSVKTVKVKKETKLKKRDPDEELSMIKNYCAEYKTKVSDTFLNQIIDLKYSDTNEYILDMDPEVSINISEMLSRDKKSEKDVLTYLASSKNRSDLLFNQECMLDARIEFEFEISALEALKDKGSVRTDIKCSQCGSNKIIVNKKQLRRADEGTTILYHCPNCGNRWTRN